MYKFVIVFVAVSFFACKNHDHDHAGHSHDETSEYADHESESESLAKVIKADDMGNFYGEEFVATPTIEFEQMVNTMSNSDTLEVVVSGYVESICQAKGCWLNMVQAMDQIESGVFVKFQDYGFFLPMDCAGQELTLKGKAYKEVTPVDELRHYAEDDGKSAEEIAAITEPIEEMKFMASGAYLKNK